MIAVSWYRNGRLRVDHVEFRSGVDGMVRAARSIGGEDVMVGKEGAQRPVWKKKEE